ncbi:MAG TPA: PIN domain-containing protein [Gammaproteobacteria bacterium]|nr:PIN domain-containing protein [Gammaproteobacteria bacterium]
MVLTDTGFWFALINRRDKHHRAAVDYMSHASEPLVSTWPVITETCYLLGRSLGVRYQLRFLEMVSSGLLEVATIHLEDMDRVYALIQKYAELPMDLADASLVLLAEKLGHGRILSTDQRDFRAYRWKNHQPFENLLLPDG